MVDSVCRTISNGTEITSVTNGYYLNTGQQINRYSSGGGGGGGWSCQSFLSSLTYNQAATADTNVDCCVNFTGTDRVCP